MDVSRRRLLQHYWYKIPALHMLKYHFMDVRHKHGWGGRGHKNGFETQILKNGYRLPGYLPLPSTSPYEYIHTHTYIHAHTYARTQHTHKTHTHIHLFAFRAHERDFDTTRHICICVFIYIYIYTYTNTNVLFTSRVCDVDAVPIRQQCVYIDTYIFTRETPVRKLCVHK